MSSGTFIASSVDGSIVGNGHSEGTSGSSSSSSSDGKGKIRDKKRKEGHEIDATLKSLQIDREIVLDGAQVERRVFILTSYILLLLIMLTTYRIASHFAY